MDIAYRDKKVVGVFVRFRASELTGVNFQVPNKQFDICFQEVLGVLLMTLSRSSLSIHF
jgi:hypothetical protein